MASLGNDFLQQEDKATADELISSNIESYMRFEKYIDNFVIPEPKGTHSQDATDYVALTESMSDLLTSYQELENEFHKASMKYLQLVRYNGTLNSIYSMLPPSDQVEASKVLKFLEVYTDLYKKLVSIYKARLRTLSNLVLNVKDLHKQLYNVLNAR